MYVCNFDFIFPIFPPKSKFWGTVTYCKKKKQGFLKTKLLGDKVTPNDAVFHPNHTLCSVLTMEPCRLLLIAPFKATLPLCDIALFKKVNTRWVLMNTHWLYMLDCPAPILNIINKGLIKWEVGGGR